MSWPTENSSSLRIHVLRKETNRVENEGCSFISAIDFPPLPKSEAIVCKDEQQKDSTYSQKLKYRHTAKHKIIKPEQKESLGNDCTSNQSTCTDKPSKSSYRFKENKEQQTDSPSAIHQASSMRPLEATVENTAHVKSGTAVEATKGKRKKGKKKVKQKQGGKITLLTPEMHHILIGEGQMDLNRCDPKCVVDISSTEEYPELDQSKQEALPSDQKSKVKIEGCIRYPSVSVISGGVASSKSSDRTSYGRIFTRSFSDLLKATSVPASSSLKFRDERVIQDQTSRGGSQSIPSNPPSTNKEEKPKRTNSFASQQGISLPKTEKESLSLPKTKKTEDSNKISRKCPNTSTPLNMSDFIVGVQSGKIKKSRIKPAGRSLEKKGNMLTPHNMLDSTAPLRKRGKEREVPKKKQLSTLKKIILRERELKKMLLSKDLVELSSPEESVPKEKSPLDGADCQLTDECKSLHDPCMAENLELTDTVPEMTNLSETKTLSVENSSPVDKRVIIAKQIIHSRNFREYCDQFISGEIDTLLSSLLHELVRFQDRLYEKDPTKAKVRRRLVCGLREVTKHLKMKKLKLLK